MWARKLLAHHRSRWNCSCVSWKVSSSDTSGRQHSSTRQGRRDSQPFQANRPGNERLPRPLGSCRPPQRPNPAMANLVPNSTTEQQPQMQPQPLSSLTTSRRPHTLIPQNEGAPGHPVAQVYPLARGNASPQAQQPVDSRPHSGSGQEDMREVSQKRHTRPTQHGHSSHTCRL